jgi:hypothetical protein
MIASLQAAIPQSGVVSFPKNIFLVEEIKALVDQEITQTNIVKRFKPRLYRYVDFIFPVLFALSSSLSIEQACKELNDFFISYAVQPRNIELKPFTDGVRKRRLIPHQTKVDKFLRRFTEKEAQQFFGNLLAQINEVIRKQTIKSSKVKFIADNTKYPYYGGSRKDTEIGSTKLPGTKLCRMFQGHSIFGCRLHLYTYFSIIKKNVYRCKDIFSQVNWLRWLGYRISHAIVDREFYRASLIWDFKKLFLPVTMPCKKYDKVKNEMKDFIRKKRDVVEDYLFTQSSNQYPNQSSAQVHLALIGHDNQTAHELRDKYYSTKITMDGIVKEMAGFFTTFTPWKNLKAFCRFLVRIYKERWNIETGFRCLNSTHISFRNRSPVKQLTQIYMKAIIYNNWQFWRKIALKKCTSYSEAAQNLFLRQYSQSIKESYASIIEDRIEFALKYKKEVYFK